MNGEVRVTLSSRNVFEAHSKRRSELKITQKWIVRYLPWHEADDLRYELDRVEHFALVAHRTSSMSTLLARCWARRRGVEVASLVRLYTINVFKQCGGICIMHTHSNTVVAFFNCKKQLQNWLSGLLGARFIGYIKLQFLRTPRQCIHTRYHGKKNKTQIPRRSWESLTENVSRYLWIIAITEFRKLLWY